MCNFKNPKKFLKLRKNYKKTIDNPVLKIMIQKHDFRRV